MMRDSDFRDTARLSLDSNIVVEAGAGTGKTTLLTDRMLFLLLGGKKNLDITQIVALTFTEKAAAEIKLRLSVRLNAILCHLRDLPLSSKEKKDAEKLAADLKSHFKQSVEKIIELAENALLDMDKAQIGTIHSFCSHLLRLYPLESGVDPGFSVDEGNFFRELFESEWELWLDRELGEHAPHAGDWKEILRLVDLEDMKKMAEDLCRPRVSLSQMGGSRHMAPYLLNLSQEVAGLGAGQPKPRSNSKIQERLAELSNHFQALSKAAENGSSPLPRQRPYREFKLSQWPPGWDPSGEPLYQFCRKIANRADPIGEIIIGKTFHLLRPFAESFRKSYNRRGLVSFDGLLIKARDLVRDNPGVRERLKREFGAVLIDEFQDTDPLQGEILIFLCEKAGVSAKKWQEAALEKGKLFVVGDPKQSIYRFRGADISAFEKFTEAMISQGALHCPLQTNFRSHSGIVDPVNHIFSSLMSPQAGFQPKYIPIDPAPGSGIKSSGMETVLIHAPETGQDSEPRADDFRQGEAEWIARWIAAHCETKKPGQERPSPGKFFHSQTAIILRSLSSLPIYLETLKRDGIPYVVEGEKYFYNTQEISDFLNLLRAVDNPTDKIALAGLLRSPLAGMSDREIYESAQKKPLSYMEGDNPFYVMLRKFHARVGRVPLGDLIHGLLNETFLVELSSMAYHGQQTASNLLKFALLASTAEEVHGATLKEFIHQVERSIEESLEEGESPLADEYLDAVRILSIHKAKGLEYPVVIVPNVCGQKPAQAKERSCLVNWADGCAGFRFLGAGAGSVAMAFMEEEEERRQEKEEIRVLYVALTRAKEKVILLGNTKAGAKGLFSKLLLEAQAWPAPNMRPDRLQLGPKEIEIPVSYFSLEEARSLNKTKKAAGKKEKTPLDAAGLAETWIKRQAQARKAAEDSLYLSPSAYLKEEEKWRVPEETEAGLPSSTASLVGRLCHKVLEKWDYRSGKANLDAALERAAVILQRDNQSENWKEILQESKEILQGFLKSSVAEKLGRVDILGREIPFVYGESGKVLRGTLDLLYKDAGQYVVADYKTGKAGEGGLDRLKEKYRLQGKYYTEAVHRAMRIKEAGFSLIFLRSGKTVDFKP